MSDAERPCPASDELRHAADALRQAHESAVERMIGKETASHLRRAAKHALQAGLAAIDQAEQRAKAGPA